MASGPRGIEDTLAVYVQDDTADLFLWYASRTGFAPNGFGKRIPKYWWLSRATGEGSLLNLECFDYCEYEIDPADRDREPSLPGEQSTWNSSEKTGQYGHGQRSNTESKPIDYLRPCRQVAFHQNYRRSRKEH